jgi:hypothetical protein
VIGQSTAMPYRVRNSKSSGVIRGVHAAQQLDEPPNASLKFQIFDGVVVL